MEILDQIYSISEINQKISDLMHDMIGLVRVKGEISELKIASSGHIYFNLKDDKSIIRCICFKHKYQFLDASCMTNGSMVVVSGKISTYQSSYSIVLDRIEYEGIGALLQMIEDRKNKLKKEGLFDDVFKKKIPKSFEISKIAIITSDKGAVIHDMLDKINSRYRHEIDVYHSQVQGKNTGIKISAIIDKIEKASNKPDVIIIARGGGSYEDLIEFNDEILARKVFACKIPIISAIGHETDFCILDFVADMRCSTPTAAAVLITTPSSQDLLDEFGSGLIRMSDRMNFLVGKYDADLFHAKDAINGERIISNLANIIAIVYRIPALNRMKIADLFFKIQEVLNLKHVSIARKKDLCYMIVLRKKNEVHDLAVKALYKFETFVLDCNFKYLSLTNDAYSKIYIAKNDCIKKIQYEIKEYLSFIRHKIDDNNKSMLSDPELKLIMNGFMIGYKNGKKISNIFNDINLGEGFDLVSNVGIVSVNDWFVKKRLIKDIDQNHNINNEKPKTC